jgi:exonuclease VII small subunit
MRYKAQTQTKLEAVNNHLLTIVKGLDTHTMSANQVAAEIQQVRQKVENIISLIELEPTDFGY